MGARDKILRGFFISPLGIATHQSKDELAIPDRNVAQVAIWIVLARRLYEREGHKINGELVCVGLL